MSSHTVQNGILTKMHADSQDTHFGFDFLSVTIDEAHPKHSAGLAILEKARIRLIMAATPLQTSTKVRSQPF
jgi:hypothetical protein